MGLLRIGGVITLNEIESARSVAIFTGQRETESQYQNTNVVPPAKEKPSRQLLVSKSSYLDRKWKSNQLTHCRGACLDGGAIG